MRTHHDFTRAFHDYYPEILAYLRRRLNDADVAEDLAGEVFYKAWRAKDRFQTGTAVRPWLYRIARNTLIDYWRKRKDVSLDETEVSLIQSADEDLQSVVERDDEMWHLQKGLDQLVGSQKSVVILRFIEGMSAKETATTLGLTEGNVRVIQLRALLKLKEFMSHEA